MAAYNAEAVSVVPAAVHPYDARYLTLSVEERQQNHLAVGMNGERYLAVHPIYSLSQRQYQSQILIAVLLVLLEVNNLLIVLLGLCTPCFTVNNRVYFAFDGGYDRHLPDSPGRSSSLLVCSNLVVLFLFFFSCICPAMRGISIPSDQGARMGEEALNKEMLVLYNVQVHGDGRAHNAFGEPSLMKEESMWGPCCGFEANEHSRLLRDTRRTGVQCLIEAIGLILQSIILYSMSWVYGVAVAYKEAVTLESGYRITALALVMRVILFLFYCYTFLGLFFRGRCRLSRCQLVSLLGNRAAGVLATTGGVTEDEYLSKPSKDAANREDTQEMVSIASAERSTQ
ncbi:hypothetical protein JKF63_03371 [Porcisia hertigi]|uniref:Uncharacterized protein n=1 Tax=Porcisia hertigi TaxID=2761500 RepID=A0A836IAH9_9TRYP|nr:hypothetical protein JKF63_03371 [Porcisia hertigi]